jgi:hypothetical protein
MAATASPTVVQAEAGESALIAVDAMPRPLPSGAGDVTWDEKRLRRTIEGASGSSVN